MKNVKRFLYIFCLLVILIILVSSVIGKIMDVSGLNYTTFYVHSEGEKWDNETSLNIFGQTNPKLIYPGKTGKYKFFVKNDGNSNIKYSIIFNSSTNLKLKMLYRFRSESDYLAGLHNEWMSLDNIKGDFYSNKNSSDSFILEWKFVDNYDLESGFYTLNVKVVNR
ncbi:MAG: hypothetical protein IKF91_03895 [Bacilli bacterium]|nr:hypothetical protein [Bacilli bacterium]